MLHFFGTQKFEMVSSQFTHAESESELKNTLFWVFDYVRTRFVSKSPVCANSSEFTIVRYQD
jgi:hypothetical protein